MRVAAVQFRPERGRPDRARFDLARLVESALQQGAQLVVCPEMAVTGYVWADAGEIGPYAEVPDGPTLAALGPLARDSGATIVVGIAERARNGLYNSALVIGPDGELCITYRKVLLFELDHAWALPGERRVVAMLGEVPVIPGICMDLNDDRFVEHVAANPGAVVAFPTNWLDEGFGPALYWQMRLGRSGAALVAANTWGTERGIPFRGESAILDHGGRILARAPRTGDSVVVADLGMRRS